MKTRFNTICTKLKTPYAATFVGFLIFGIVLFAVNNVTAKAEITKVIQVESYQPNAVYLVTQKVGNIFFFPSKPTLLLAEISMTASSEDVLIHTQGLFLLPLMFIVFFCVSAFVWSLPVWGIIYFLKKQK